MEPNLRGVTIFRVGRWNNMEFTDGDLDDIAANFEALKDVHKAPLKLGHSGERDVPEGQPALGWVTRVWREGATLLADFANVPSKLLAAIKNKRYRTVSIELLLGVTLGAKTYKNVLDAVALLGAEQPAVLGLGDLDQYLATRTTFAKIEQTVSIDLPEDADPRDDELAQLRAQLAAAEKRADTAEDTVRRHERDEARAKTERAELARRERVEMIRAKRGEARAVLEAAVTAREITPAQRDYLRQHHRLDDDAAVEALDLAALRPMAVTFGRASGVRMPHTDSTGFAQQRAESEGAGDPGEQLIRMTREYMAKTGEKNFQSALDVVAAANPKLHREYLLSNGEVA